VVRVLPRLGITFGGGTLSASPILTPEAPGDKKTDRNAWSDKIRTD